MKNKIPSYNISDLLNQKGWVDFEIRTFKQMEDSEIEDQHKHNFYGSNCKTDDMVLFKNFSLSVPDFIVLAMLKEPTIVEKIN